jgi:hypothetical protein
VLLSLLLAAHEGEELAIALPAVMLGAALLILKWAASNGGAVPEEEEPPPPPPGPVADEEATRAELVHK